MARARLWPWFRTLYSEIPGIATTLNLTAGRHAHTARGAAGLQAFIGLLLFFGGNHGLACVAALPDPGSGNELSGAAAALFRHRLLQRENPRFLGQQMGIVEIAMIHVRRLSALTEWKDPW